MVQNQLISEIYWRILTILNDREKEIEKEPCKERYYQKTLAKKLSVTAPTIKDHLSDLKKWGYVKAEKKSIDKGGVKEDLILTDEGKFMVMVHQPLQVEAIKSTIEQLKKELRRMPKVDEIACKVGRDPEDQAVRCLIFAVGSIVDWYPPDLMKPSDFNQFDKHVISIGKGKKKS